MLNLVYNEIVVAGCLYMGNFSWYVSDKEYWTLDLRKVQRALAGRNYHHSLEELSEHRFGILVLDSDTAPRFLDSMAPYRVTVPDLRREWLLRLESDDPDDFIDARPALYADFDGRVFRQVLPEPASYETYAPDGWDAKYDSFRDMVPAAQRYWIVDGVDTFDFKIQD